MVGIPVLLIPVVRICCTFVQIGVGRIGSLLVGCCKLCVYHSLADIGRSLGCYIAVLVDRWNVGFDLEGQMVLVG